MLTIDTAGPDAVAELLADIRAEDAAEMAAASVDGQSLAGVPLQALRWHGRLVALFGLAGLPRLDGAGVPWMLCTNALKVVPRRAMAGISRRVVDDWMSQRSMLINMVHAKNRQAIRFVQWLGFTVGNQPTGPGGEFLTFYWSRPDV